MEKSKRTVIKLIIVLISFLFINGGKSYMLSSNYEQILFTNDLVNDIEIPHQQHFANFSDEEKWLETFKFEFSSIPLETAKGLLTLNSSTQEFSDSIWQPPKSV
jgi:hypothetical protein